jgi:predicted lipid carrier protein YhbT
MQTIPEFALPAPLAALGRRLPQWPHALALSLALEAARRLGLVGADDLQALEGRVVRVSVTDAGACAAITVRRGRFVPAAAGAAADLGFAAPLAAFLQMLARQQDPDTLFFHRKLAIEGDTELGLVVKNLLDRIDWGEALRAATGRRA